MARKRKKSKKARREKAQSDQPVDEPVDEAEADVSSAGGSDADATPESTTDGDEPIVFERRPPRTPFGLDDDEELEVIVLDDDEPVDDVVDLDDDVPEAIIDVEEDLDDPEARAALIAAVAGFAADGPPTLDDDNTVDGSASENASTQEEGPGNTDDVSTPAAVLDTDASDVPVDGDEAGDPETDRPLIGRDALSALSQFRAEGIATVPEELVLELGEATSPEERDRLLAAALAHVEMQEAIYRVPTDSAATRRWKGLVAVLVFLAALTLVGLPPRVLVPEPPPTLSVAEREAGVRLALLVQAEQIEAFRAREGRLPTSLEEVPRSLPGIRFIRSSNRLYQLTALGPGGTAIVFDSAAPEPAFDAVDVDWLSTGRDS